MRRDKHTKKLESNNFAPEDVYCITRALKMINFCITKALKYLLHHKGIENDIFFHVTAGNVKSAVSQ